MAQRISTAPGVAQVSIFGSQKYAVRAQLDPRELATRGIGIDEVVSAIQNGNSNLPTGTLYGPTQASTVAIDRATHRRERVIANLIVAYRNGSPVRLEQTRDVSSTAWRTTRSPAGSAMTRGMVLAVQKQPGTNTVEVVDAVRQSAPDFPGADPAGGQLDVLSDNRFRIRESVHDVRVHARPRDRPGGARDLPVPAELRATLIPSSRCRSR